MLARLTKKGKSIHIPTFSETDLELGDLPENIHDIIKLVQLTKQDLENLRMIDDVMEEDVEKIAKLHYEMVMDIPEIKEIFNTYTTYERYVPAIINYFKQLTKPELDHAYIWYRKKIGAIHSQIRLTEEWHIGSYMRVYEYLVPHIAARYASKPQLIADILGALHRIITFDTILVLQAYKEVNDFQLIENVSDAMDEITKIDEVGNLLSVVRQTTAEANEVNRATQQLNESVDEIAETANAASSRTKIMVEQASDSKHVGESWLTGFLMMID